MMLTEDAVRELVADRFRTLQAAYSSTQRPAVPRRTRRKWRLAFRRPNPGRTSLAAGQG